VNAVREISLAWWAKTLHRCGEWNSSSRVALYDAFTKPVYGAHVGGTDMRDDDKRAGAGRRKREDRRSGVDTRSADEKRRAGERRSGGDRREGTDRRSAGAAAAISKAVNRRKS
jgi:hypothetical protein